MTELTTEPTFTAHHAAALAHLRSLNRRAFLTYAIDVGQYLVQHFFAGDFAELHSNDPQKSASFNAFLLVHRQDLAELDLNTSTLRRYIAAAEVWHGLPEATRTQLGLRHLQSLAAVGDPAERKRLAHEAVALHWSKEQVALAVKEYKDEHRKGKVRGRKKLPHALKAATELHAAMERMLRLHAAALRLAEPHRSQFAAKIEAVHLGVQRLRVAPTVS